MTTVNKFINPWCVLGLEEGASDKEIKKAFRDLAKKHHPDKGGDAEVFAQISRAFALIKTKDARKQFEKDQGQPEKPLTSMAIEIILLKVMQGIRNTQQINDLKYQPILEKCENAFNEDLAQMRVDHRKARGQIEIMTDLISRFSYNGEDSNDFIGHTLKEEVKATKKHLKSVERQMRVAARAKKLLTLYSYRRDQRDTQQWGSHQLFFYGD